MYHLLLVEVLCGSVARQSDCGVGYTMYSTGPILEGKKEGELGAESCFPGNKAHKSSEVI